MVPSVLLVHRHEWPGGQVTRIEPQPVEHWELSRSELAGFCGCPVDALRFARVGPVHLAHGGAWARLEAQRVGDSAAMLRIRLEVQRERAEWALRWGSAVS